MSIDISLVRDIDSYFTSLLQGQAQPLVYLRRFSRDYAPYGRCSYCYDDTTGQITNSKCPICFGTGYDKGYSDPVQGTDAPPNRVYGFFTHSNYVTDWQKTGIVTVQEDLLCYLKLPFQPGLSDLIIDNDGVYYLVGNHVEDWSWNDIQYGYVATVYEQDPQNSWKYNVPVPPSLFGNRSYVLSNLNVEVSDAVQISLNESYGMDLVLEG